MDSRGLLLCGGASVRFGRNKLLESIEGTPMAALTARTMARAIHRVLAVTRTGEHGVREILEAEGCEVMASDRTLLGLGASLSAGIAASADASGWVVALADMPFIREETFHAVREALEAGASIAAPLDRASGRRGHPVGFSAALRQELLELDGDEGARSVIARHANSVALIEVDDPGIFRDIDRPEDLVSPPAS